MSEEKKPKPSSRDDRFSWEPEFVNYTPPTEEENTEEKKGTEEQ